MLDQSTKVQTSSEDFRREKLKLSRKIQELEGQLGQIDQYKEMQSKCSFFLLLII